MLRSSNSRVTFYYPPPHTSTSGCWFLVWGWRPRPPSSTPLMVFGFQGCQAMTPLMVHGFAPKNRCALRARR